MPTWTQRGNTDFFLCTTGQGHSGSGISQFSPYNTVWVDQSAASGGTANLFTCNGGANGGASYGGSTGNVMGLYYYSTPVMLTDQYSQATMQTVPTLNKRIGVAARIQSSGMSAYALWYDVPAGTLRLVQVTGILPSAFTLITETAKTYVATNKLRLEVTGIGSATRLAAYEDTGSGFVSVFSNVDPGGSYINGGQPGITGDAAASTGVGGVLDDWAGGDSPPDAQGPQGGASGYLTNVRKLSHYGSYDTDKRLPRHIERLAGITENDDELILLLILHELL